MELVEIGYYLGVEWIIGLERDELAEAIKMQVYTAEQYLRKTIPISDRFCKKMVKIPTKRLASWLKFGLNGPSLCIKLSPLFKGLQGQRRDGKFSKQITLAVGELDKDHKYAGYLEEM